MTLRPAPPDAEIGRTPHRDRSTSASRAVVVQCVVVSRMSRASPLWVGSTGARVCQGRSSLKGEAYKRVPRCPRMPGAVGRCCTLVRAPRQQKPRNHAEQQRQQQPRPHLPCAQPPSPHMGARPPHTTITRKAHHSNKKHPPPPQSTQPPKTTTPTTPRVEIGPVGSSSIITTRNPPKSSGFGTNGLKRLSLSQGEGWNHAVLCRGADGSDPACPES